jgi:hypothetical protein
MNNSPHGKIARDRISRMRILIKLSDSEKQHQARVLGIYYDSNMRHRILNAGTSMTRQLNLWAADRNN